MDRDEFIKRLKPVQDITIRKDMKVRELIEEFSKIGGFVAKKVYIAAEILADMLLDDKSTNFLAFPAAIIATGLRGVIVEMVKRGFFDVIITTCGTIDHDIARTRRRYYQGWFEADDLWLNEMNIHRLGNIFIPIENYGIIIEEVAQKLLKKLWREGISRISTRELIWQLADVIDEQKDSREKSLIWWARRKGIPIYVPGITDGAFGYQIWLFSQDKDFIIDILRDETEISEIIYDSERTGALIIGGGISKHHVIWWNQFKEGLNRAVYITTAVEWDGSLSGARTREAISWGKISKKAQHVTVEGDATYILPLLASYLIDKVGERKNKKLL
ncbi:MAG: deoxyhypusine synthase [Candidatus Njordarchaeales archaeon]